MKKKVSTTEKIAKRIKNPDSIQKMIAKAKGVGESAVSMELKRHPDRAKAIEKRRHELVMKRVERAISVVDHALGSKDFNERKWAAEQVLRGVQAKGSGFETPNNAVVSLQASVATIDPAVIDEKLAKLREGK